MVAAFIRTMRREIALLIVIVIMLTIFLCN